VTTFTATYSPEDNKLRLYASSRLDAETYARVKAAGFSWAPKQELFVAPAWSPSREDMLTELAGAIDDEDTSLVDRAEARAERFEDYSDKRHADAERASDAVRKLSDGIPLGQPILVGHHSERHARKDAARIENGMRHAVKMWETAGYWTDRAASAVAHAKYLERPDVRARRIKGLEADLRKVTKNRDRSANLVKMWSDPVANLKRKDGEPVTLRAAVLFIANNLDGGYFAAEYKHRSGYVGPISRWEAAGGNIDGADPEAVAIATPEEICAQAIASHSAYLPAAQRWIDHYNNRLAYERAMLADAGGTVAQRTGPEKGGACKCWASPRGGWSYIVKVNKVTVTVLDNWGNGGNHFTRNVELEKLSAVMTAAQVAEARAAGRVFDREPDASGKVDGFILNESAPVDPMPAEPMPEATQAAALVSSSGRDAICTACGNRKGEHNAGPMWCPAPGGGWILPSKYTETPSAPTPEARPGIDRETVDAMRATLKAGVTVAVVPDLFPTPAALARRMVDAADIMPGNRVLEPSAGTGNIADAILRRAAASQGVTLQIVECDQRLAEALEKFGAPVRCADFLACNGELGTFDRIVMNPPFSGGVDIAHIRHAREHLSPGGRLVALCADGPRQRAAFADDGAIVYESLPAGTFAAAGTNVNVALLVIEGAL